MKTRAEIYGNEAYAYQRPQSYLILFTAGVACFLLAAVAAALAADIFLNVVKNRHQRLAVFGQAVLDPGRDLVVVDALHQPVF